MNTALVVVLSYLVGSIPTSDIVGRICGVNIREVGSGNPGFTNTLRALGPKVATPVLIIDIGKGLLAVLVIADLMGASSPLGPSGIRLAGGLAAVAGHIWPVFARFRGGKGVATACGVFLAMAPLATLAAVLVWLGLVFSTGYVSVGSIVATLVLPWAVWYEAVFMDARPPTALTITAMALAIVVAVRHWTNIGRLANGTENRFGRRGRQGGTQ